MKYYCGTPQNDCTGSFCKEGGQAKHKLHASIIEARICFKRYVISLGYIQDILLKNRFVRGEDEPAKFLTRKVS